MNKNKFAGALADSQHDASVMTVTIGRDAANHDGVTAVATRETLDTLRVKYGLPAASIARVAFAGYDAREGLEMGREVATGRILAAVPSLARQVDLAWGRMAATQRAHVLGYHPGLLAVLVHETTALRDMNLRYDAVSRAEASNRETATATAAAALRDGRAEGEQYLRIAQRWAPEAFVERVPLVEAMESAQNPDALALSLDTLGSWFTAWRASWSADERDGFESLGFTDAVATALHARATAIRETQAVLDALVNTTRVSQRELDTQDGRVLHLVDLVYAAFRQAARRDPMVYVPDLGELATVFERPRSRASNDGDAPPPTPPTPPTPPARPATPDVSPS